MLRTWIVACALLMCLMMVSQAWGVEIQLSRRTHVRKYLRDLYREKFNLPDDQKLPFPTFTFRHGNNSASRTRETTVDRAVTVPLRGGSLQIGEIYMNLQVGSPPQIYSAQGMAISFCLSLFLYSFFFFSFFLFLFFFFSLAAPILILLFFSFLFFSVLFCYFLFFSLIRFNLIQLVVSKWTRVQVTLASLRLDVHLVEAFLRFIIRLFPQPPLL